MTSSTTTTESNKVVNGNLLAKDKLENELESINKSLAALNAESASRNRKPETEIQLQEKKSICLLKLRKYQQAVEDGYRTIGKKGPSVVIFKCILSALCRLRKYDEVHEVLDQWKRLSPKDVHMIETKQKLERILSAIRSGLKPEEVFQNLEQSLGLNSEWIYRKSISANGNFKFRAPPSFSPTFFLCPRGQNCIFGEKCTGAHSQEELVEWKLRLEARNKNWEMTRTTLIRPNTSLQYLIGITKRINETTNIRKLLADEIPGVKFKCSTDLKKTCYERGKDVTWQMLIVTRSPLRTISLLHEVHRSNFWISAASFYSVSSKENLDLFDLHVVNKGPQLQVCNTFVAASIFQEKFGGWPEWFWYQLEVSFNATMFGSYRQTIMFDMKFDPKLVKHLSVELQARSTFAEEELMIDQELKIIRNPQKVNMENYEVVDSDAGVQVNSMFKTPSPCIPDPPNNNNTRLVIADELTRDKYISTMGAFLTIEETARQDELNKYNITGNLELTSKYTIERDYESLLKCSWEGQLYAKLNLQKEISEDTKLGRLILRNCQNVLLFEVKTNVVEKPRGFICKIADKMKSSIIIALGQSAVKELNLISGTTRHFLVQFMLDNRNFKEMRAVLESITDVQLDILFPNFSQKLDFSSIVKNKSGLFFEGDYTLNEKQMQAYNAITNEHQKNMPPLLVIGPFGTGKTECLAQSLKKILSNNSTLATKSRILVCTHSNSAADLYITKYLHQWFVDGLTSCRPLRIYYADRLVQTVPHIVKKYCLLTGDGMNFRYPTKEEVLDYRVIIVTLSTSIELLDLGLDQNTFTHILLDEACQAYETEAIQPLMLTGPHTTIVLAGDHMQLSPELFSTFSQGRAISLLERLHTLYPQDHPCRIVLTENYRSHQVILRFASEAFYDCQLRCASLQPSHLSLHPLTFFAVRGEDVLSENASSFYNMAEVFEVAERVEELIRSWPEQWGHFKDDNSIAILTPYAEQVTRIRAQLRSRGLGFVSVERVLNVQGKQFRAVFVSTVRTQKPWVPTSENIDLGFFSDPKLLNTALTRAQSLFACVGDPISLCSTGPNRNIWVEFIAIAATNNSFFGMNHEDLKQQLLGLEMKEAYGYNPLAISSTTSTSDTTGSDSLGIVNYHNLSLLQHSSNILTSQGPSLLFGNPIRPQLISPIPQATPAQIQQSNTHLLSASSSPQKEDFFDKINSTLDQTVFKSTFEDSLEEKQAKDFVDKLLFPNVASIWSNSSSSGSNNTNNINNNNIIGTGSYNNTALSYNDNIWAPPSNSLSRQDDSFFFSSSKLPETALSSRNLQQQQQPSTQYSSTSSFSPECFDEIITSAGNNNNNNSTSGEKFVTNLDSISLPLHELNFNSQSYLQKDIFNRYMVQSSPIHKQQQQQQLPFQSSSASSSLSFNNNTFSHNNNNNTSGGSSSIVTNNFGSHEVPNTYNITSIGTFKQLSLPSNDIQFKPLTTNHINNNNNKHDPSRQGQPQQSQSLILNHLLSSYQQPSKQLPQQKSKKPTQYQHQPLFQQGGGFNDSIHDYSKMESRLSPETSISSPEISEYISSNDFPSLQEAVKGKPDKQQHQKKTQPQQQPLQKTCSNTSSSNSSSSVGGNNNDWVQVKKKKNKVKDPTPAVPNGEEKVDTLVNMGFDKKIAIKALQHSQRNLDLAIEWLLSKSGNHNGDN